MTPAEALAREVFRELVEIDSTLATTEAVEAVARRLLAAGLPEAELHRVGPHPDKLNLVARLRGTGARRPLLLLAHLDVVEADPDDWSTPPFAFVERDDHFYGRGTTDDKAMAAIWVANFVRYLEEGWVPERDLILALTADEETGEHNGAQWLVDERFDLVDAELGLNEGGHGRIKGGRRVYNAVQASEKVYQDYLLEAHGRGGHSSLPTADVSIYHLAEALRRLAALQFPVRIGEVARAFFERMSGVETGQVAADMRAVLRDPPDPEALARLSLVPQYNGVLRTTCVATRLEAGHSNNTIPQTASAVLNCRILPGEDPEDVHRTLVEHLADEQVEVRPMMPPKPSPPSPLDPAVMGPVERITEALWPGVPAIPVMGIGATDSLRFRKAGVRMYGVSGIFLDVDDVRAHCPDERILVRSFLEGREFLDRLVRELAG